MTRSVWIEDCKGKYKIFADGRVQSFCNGEAKFLKSYDNNHGYLRVSLMKGGKRKLVLVHALVAKHFVPGFKPGLQVNHKNFNKLDNRAENLEWITKQENLRHALLNNRGNSFKPVKAIHIETGEGLQFESIRDGARFLKGSAGRITECCKGRSKFHKGYYWSYAQ